MCRLFISMLLTLAVLSVQAVTVQCEPGKLSTLLANRTVTELTVLGSMDARDFKYIVEHQRQVTSLNLFSVSVVSHHSNKPLYANVRDYKADELPTMALAQLTHLKQLTLPAQVTTIGEGALAACTSLTTVTLPQELRSLGKYAFAGCTALSTVALPSRLITIDEGAFAQCTALATVTLAQPISPNPGTSPFEQAPANVRHVGSKAFEGCIMLKSVALGNQVQTIGDAAFAGTKLTSADLSGMTMLTQVGDWAYAQTNITQAALPNTTTELGRGAFMLNPSLTHVTLPNKLATLSPLTLAGSSQLSDIALRQSSIDTIGAYALYNLSHVSHIVLPASTQYLGDKAMAGMTGLEQITTYASSVPELGEDVWDGVDQPSVVLKAPANSADYYLSADQWRLFNIQLSSLLGDVNDDGLIDIADLNAIINYMLGSPNIVFIFDAADIDQNGEIDISDVNGIINLMLGKIMAMPSSVEPNTTDALNIDNFAIAAGERHTIDVQLDDTHTYTSLQCVIHLPQGLSLVDGTVVVGQRAANHKVAMLNTGQDVRIILYAMPNVNFDNNRQPVLRLTVVADDQLAELSDIIIDHVVMATTDGEAYYAPMTKAQVSKTSDVGVVQHNDDRVYSANGTLHIVASQTAQAQVIAINGMTRNLSVQAGDNVFHNIDPGFYVVRLNGCSYKVKI